MEERAGKKGKKRTSGKAQGGMRRTPKPKGRRGASEGGIWKERRKGEGQKGGHDPMRRPPKIFKTA